MENDTNQMLNQHYQLCACVSVITVVTGSRRIVMKTNQTKQLQTHSNVEWLSIDAVRHNEHWIR